MIRLSLFGIPTCIRPSFWLIMALFGGGLGLLSNPTTNELVNCSVFMGAGFLSILVHELGHALIMKRYQQSPQIILHGMGGLAFGAGAVLNRPRQIFVNIMGPISQCLLGLIALALLLNVGSPDAFPTLQSHKFVKDLAEISIYWSLINLIPIKPLDGGNILSAILGPKRQKFVYITAIVLGTTLIYVCYNIGAIFGCILLAMLVIENFKSLKENKKP